MRLVAVPLPPIKAAYQLLHTEPPPSSLGNPSNRAFTRGRPLSSQAAVGCNAKLDGPNS